MDGDQEFGVVLIERGSEVGGNDVRTSVGTVARIIETAELDDGRWVLGTVGTRRIRVREWLPDDPYPRADVDDWPDEAPAVDTSDLYSTVVARLRRVLGLKAELAEPAVDATVELSDDPAMGSYQVSAVAPIGPADQQRLLVADGSHARLVLLESLLSEESDYLAARLGME
jgi:Lon protease-like protein